MFNQLIDLHYQNKIIDFWFPYDSKGKLNYQAFWFDQSCDNFIKKEFTDLINKAGNNELDHWKVSVNGSISLILLMDQFTRNIFRNSNDYRLHDKKALLISQHLIDNNDDIHLPFTVRMFILLPLRHARTTILLDKVINRLNLYQESNNVDDEKSFNRFKQATLKDYSKVTDTIIVHQDHHDIEPKFNDVILDDKCDKYKLCFDMSIRSYPLYQSVKRFVVDNNIRRIGISLSGGVDSMVLAFICVVLRDEFVIDEIYAVHLDYGNRNISEMECSYIVNWCKYMGITCVTRRIEHFKRDNTERAFYEIETKNIRYMLYKYVCEKYNVFGFCLGHHKDDLGENVFMNICRNADITDLFVMKKIMYKDDVYIMRPMLDHVKNEIYEISEKFGISYFKDTTPITSMRGFTRGLFNKMDNFDKCITQNIVKIGLQSNDIYNDLQNIVINPIVKTIVAGPCGFSIQINDGILGLSLSLLTKTFVQVFHTQGYHMITHKNMKQFYENIQKVKKPTTRLSNGFFCVFSNNKLYFVKSFICDKFKLQINKFGPWNITIINHQQNDPTLDDLISGRMYINNAKSFKYFGWLKQFMIPSSEISTKMILSLQNQ